MSSPSLRVLLARDLNSYAEDHFGDREIFISESRALGCAGMDSLALTEFVAIVSKRRGLRVDDDDFRRFINQKRGDLKLETGKPTVGELLDFLVACKKEE